MGSAPKKEWWWPVVPVHRVIAKNAGIGGAVEWGDHGLFVEDRVEALRDEGMGFDSRGKLIGATCTEFR